MQLRFRYVWSVSLSCKRCPSLKSCDELNKVNSQGERDFQFLKTINRSYSKQSIVFFPLLKKHVEHFWKTIKKNYACNSITQKGILFSDIFIMLKKYCLNVMFIIFFNCHIKLKWWRKYFQTANFSLLECTALRNVITGLIQTLENQCNIKGKRKMFLHVLYSNIVWTGFLIFSFRSLCFLERSSLASRLKWNKVYLKSILCRFWFSIVLVNVYYCYSA